MKILLLINSYINLKMLKIFSLEKIEKQSKFYQKKKFI